MKDVILVFVIFCLTSQLVQAQCYRFDQKIDINFGVGVLPTFVKDRGTAKVLPTTLIADYKFTSNFSLGLAAAYSVTESEVYQFQDGTSGQWRNTYTAFTLRMAAYKTLFDDRWECYGGVNVGYTNSNLQSIEGDLAKIKQERRIGRPGSNFLYTAFLGARYAVSDRFGCFGELGFGVSFITVGASVRL